MFIANEEKDENMCAYYDADDCRFAYVYSYDQSGKIEIRAQKERECPPQVHFMGILNIRTLHFIEFLQFII